MPGQLYSLIRTSVRAAGLDGGGRGRELFVSTYCCPVGFGLSQGGGKSVTWQSSTFNPQRTFTHANSPVAPSSLRIDTLLRGPLSTILRRSSPISTYSAILALFMGETDNHSVVSMERLKKGIQYDSCTFRRSSTLSLFVPKCMLTHFHSPQDTRLPLNHV